MSEVNPSQESELRSRIRDLERVIYFFYFSSLKSKREKKDHFWKKSKG